MTVGKIIKNPLSATKLMTPPTASEQQKVAKIAVICGVVALAILFTGIIMVATAPLSLPFVSIMGTAFVITGGVGAIFSGMSLVVAIQSVRSVENLIPSLLQDCTDLIVEYWDKDDIQKKHSLLTDNQKIKFLNEGRCIFKDLGFETYRQAFSFIKKHNKKLTNIDLLEYENIGKRQLKQIKAVCPDLKALALNYCTNSANRDKDIVDYLKTLKLERLSLCCTKLTNESLELLQGLPLQRLNLMSCFELTDEGFLYLKEFPLEHLDLYVMRITNDDLAHLKELALKRLKLMCLDITDAGLAHLKKLPLEDLRLSLGRFTDAGLAHLKELPLKHLSLNGSAFPDAGLVHLKELPLKQLNIYRCEGITDQGVSLLRTSLEGCEIRYTRYSDQ
jgi:hypothetical protein